MLRKTGWWICEGEASREFLKMDSFVWARLVRWMYQRARRRVLLTAEQFHGMGLYRLRGTLRYPAQAASVRSSLSRVREKPHARFEKGFVENGLAIVASTA